MKYNTNELKESFFRATGGDLTSFFKSVADRFDIHEEIVECRAISVTDNLVEALELYPECYQFYIDEVRALDSFKDYVIEMVSELSNGN